LRRVRLVFVVVVLLGHYVGRICWLLPNPEHRSTLTPLVSLSMFNIHFIDNTTVTRPNPWNKDHMTDHGLLEIGVAPGF